jgi:3-dehydroquinate dehydratase II
MTMKKILLIHGPNLNLLGHRDPKHYGRVTLKDIETLCKSHAKKYSLSMMTFQSNHEGDLIDTLQKKASHCAGIIINPGALTHYSYALYDALLDTQRPVVEVHLSKIKQREKWRSQSVTAPACIKVIWGKKEQGYLLAITTLAKYFITEKTTSF